VRRRSRALPNGTLMQDTAGRARGTLSTNHMSTSVTARPSC
jgi:hypothetical protein